MPLQLVKVTLQRRDGLKTHMLCRRWVSLCSQGYSPEIIRRMAFFSTHGTTIPIPIPIPIPSPSPPSPTRRVLTDSSPGWVRTDMAGPRAPLTVDQGAKTPVKLCLLREGAVNGRFCKTITITITITVHLCLCQHYFI